jgi:hypothetical protein
LTLIGLPHGDDLSRHAARRPNDDDDSTGQLVGVDETRLAVCAVVFSLIRPRQVRPVEYLLGPPEIESPLLQGPIPLGAAEGDSRGIYRRYSYSEVQPAPPSIDRKSRQ